MTLLLQCSIKDKRQMRYVFNFWSGWVTYPSGDDPPQASSKVSQHFTKACVVKAAEFLPGLLSKNVAVSCFILHRVPFQFSFGQIQETKELTGLLRSFAAINQSLNRVTQFLKGGQPVLFSIKYRSLNPYPYSTENTRNPSIL